MNKPSSFALLALSLGASGALAAPTVTMTAGQNAVEIQSETVRYDAAAIDDRRSAKQLFYRFRQAAEDVCRISPAPRGYEIWYERDCEAAAVEQAVRDADLPALDAYYFGDAGAGPSAR